MANRRRVAELLPVLAEALLESSSDESSSSSSDDGHADRRPPRKLPKSRTFFQMIDRMDVEEFRSHFRLGHGELLMIVTYDTRWSSTACVSNYCC